MATPDVIGIPQTAEDIAPSWVQQVLQRDVPGVTITDVDVKGSVSQGEGFMSDVIAFDAGGTRDGGETVRYSLVAKLSDFTRPFALIKTLTKEGLIKCERDEVEFYSNAVPDLLSVSDKSAKRTSEPNGKDEGALPSTESLFLAKCYFAATDPSSMVSVRVMENLKTQGFSIKRDLQLLSREEMMLTVGALAQLHGLSHRLEIRSGVPLREKYGFLTKSPLEVTTTLYQSAVKTFTAAFPDQKDLVARLEKLDPQDIQLDAEKSPRLKVLNHGDCWIINILFKHVGDVPMAVKLVDWQLPQYFPPTYDLAFLFLCSTGWDVFHNHRDAILAHYHRQLMDTLGQEETSGLQSYTLEQLKEDFKVDCQYGVVSRFIRLMALPIDVDLLRMVQEVMEWGAL
ncbi:uncharacterized protein [Branchiostoma lanceolatum]|uniref:uncharacterized protein n=1 Tax=Branchiostoma lanceolatum TaxID=7740 RepID=UPI003452E541